MKGILVLAVLIIGLAFTPASADENGRPSPVGGLVLTAQAPAVSAPGADVPAGPAGDAVPDQGDAGFSEDIFDEYETSGEAAQLVADPIMGFNRAMFVFNDYLYFYGLKPIAQGYKAVVPTPARRGVNNFFNNLLFPVRFVNKLLQGKFEGAGDEFSAFFVNSTLGILGFNDFAQKYMGVRLHDEDFGQTLGSYNIGDGFYLVLPVLGPSTLRDAAGRAGDWFITPVNYLEPWELSWGVWAVDKVNRTSFRIGDYEALKEASFDPYVAFRNAYIQNRRSQIRQ